MAGSKKPTQRGMLGGMAKNPEDACSIARTLGVVGERWTFLILREAFLGATRFAEFRDRLGVAPDILSDRLATLVEYGVMAREPYREPGARSRSPPADVAVIPAS